jgi:hypothetical protein
MLAEPRLECLGCAIFQQIDRAVPLKIDQDRVVALASSPRPVIDSEDSWGCHGGLSRQVDETQDCRPTGGQSSSPGEPGAGRAAEGEPNVLQRGMLAVAASAPDPDKLREAFSEGQPRTTWVGAAEAADFEPQAHLAAATGQVRDSPPIALMDTIGGTTATRTRGSGLRGNQREGGTVLIEHDLLHVQAGEMGQQGNQFDHEVLSTST